MRRKPLLLAVLVVLAAPAVARAGGMTVVARNLPVRAALAGSAASALERFQLVGFHWQGAGRVQFRTRTPGGRWSRWRVADAEPEDLPDRQSAEGARDRAWRIGNPYWVGSADRLEYRSGSAVRRLRAFFVRGSARNGNPIRIGTAAGSPAIVSRAAWGANEAIRRGQPLYADAVHFAIVHHTAGSNSYGPNQSAAIVRAIEAYHVRGNGWNDIAYNFLIDKYGRVFEGRYGGIERPVVGAHAQGFNRGSVGVALLGNYDSSGVSPAAREALARLLAWRLDVAHVDPLSTVTWPSSGNPRYPFGREVTLRAISGHRDTGPTSCPGRNLYAQLSTVAQSAAVTGLPKIYSPQVRGELGGRVRFTARLSAAVPWVVTVDGADGQTVATGSGTGPALDWTWDSTSAEPGGYVYTIAAGPGARPVNGTLGRLAPLTLSRIRIVPPVVTPNGDGRSESAEVHYRLGAAARVTVMLLDASGVPLATLFSGSRPAGTRSFSLAELDVPDGRYRIALTARNSGKEVSGGADLLVDRTLAAFAASPAFISPNGDGRADSLTFSFRLALYAGIRLGLGQVARSLGTVLAADLPPGEHRVVWDGRLGGARLPDGRYTALLSATDSLTTVSQTAAVVLDTKRPRLALVSARRLLFRLNEPATVTVTVNGRRIVKRERAGLFRVPYRGLPRRVRATAVDSAGNESTPVVARRV